MVANNKLTIDELIKDTLRDKDVKDFVNSQNISKEIFNDNINVFLSFLVKKEKCQVCHSLDECTQSVMGYQAVLDNDDGVVNLANKPCAYQKAYLNITNKNKFLKLICADNELLKHDELYINPNRQNVLAEIKKFLVAYTNKKPTNGLYIHGPYGCGKTYLIAYLASELVDKGHQVVFAYYPDLVRKLKSSIGKETFEELINELKKAEILILDDFGGETPNSFIRDEVLLPILQERMQKKMPVFMTSNLNPETLMDHLSEGTRDIDKNRASRVFERIRVLMKFISLEDKNYR